MGYANGDREAICLICGQRDSADNVIRIVGEHAEYSATIQFERRMEENASGNRFARIKLRPMSRQQFRWQLMP